MVLPVRQRDPCALRYGRAGRRRGACSRNSPTRALRFDLRACEEIGRWLDQSRSSPSPRLRGEGRGEGLLDVAQGFAIGRPIVAPHPASARRRADSDLSPQAGRGGQSRAILSHACLFTIRYKPLDAHVNQALSHSVCLQYDTSLANPVVLFLIEDRKRATSGCRFLGHQTETLEHVHPCTDGPAKICENL